MKPIEIVKGIRKMCLMLVLFCGTMQMHGQDSKAEVEAYFGQYLNNRAQLELIAVSLPTLDQCKQVFKGENAITYFKFVSKLDKEILEKMSGLDYEEHAKCKVDAIKTDDLGEENTNYDAGMHEYAEVLKNDITFYQLRYFFENGEEAYNSTYKFFVNLEGEWVFFANPGIVFRK